MHKIDEIYTDHPYYGYRRVCAELNKTTSINLKKVRRLMRKMGLYAIYPKRNLSKMYQRQYIHPYLLRHLPITRANQVWAADLTYVRMGKGFMYLFVIIDVFSRYVIDYELSSTLEKGFVLDCLKRAFAKAKPEMINSDQGSHFTNEEYVNLDKVLELIHICGLACLSKQTFINWLAMIWVLRYLADAFNSGYWLRCRHRCIAIYKLLNGTNTFTIRLSAKTSTGQGTRGFSAQAAIITVGQRSWDNRMAITLSDFMHQLMTNPSLAIIVLLTLGVILVNGWTDAPNAIATCVSTRSLLPRAAILMAAGMNFLGVLVMTLVNSTVAQTIFKMVNFAGDSRDALITLCAAMFAIVVWATAAWWFGIPTSESHALIAGLSGAAIALNNGLTGINGQEWVKVLYGLALSSFLGFSLGWLTSKSTELVCQRMDRRKTEGFFKNAQIASSAAMAFMHGAQDGQKFISVFLLGVFLANGQGGEANFAIPFWLIIVCSSVMTLGTSIGGYRIIKAVGMDMVKLTKYQGFSADAAAATCLLLSSLTGIPVSTTHTKTTAIMGVGASHRLSAVKWSVVSEMVLAWVLTFPGCGLIGFLMVKLFMRIF